MSAGRLIEFKCDNPQHEARPASGVGTITVHEGRWAYCVSQLADEHDWKPIEAVAVERLFRVKAEQAVAPTNGEAPATASRKRRPRASSAG